MIRRKIQVISLCLLLLWSGGGTYASGLASIDTFFTENERQKVLAGGIITYAYLKGRDAITTESSKAPVISLPDTPYFRGSDFLSHEMVAVEKAFIPHAPLDYVDYQRLISPATLVDMPYYSRTDRGVSILILESSPIASPKMLAPAEFRGHQLIPARQAGFLKMVDNRFGELTFKRETHSAGKDLMLLHTSTSPMKRLFSSINKAGENRLGYYLLFDSGAGGYFYYAFHTMRIRSELLLGLGLLSAESFANRMRAGTVNVAKQLGLDWRERLAAFQ